MEFARSAPFDRYWVKDELAVRELERLGAQTAEDAQTAQPYCPDGPGRRVAFSFTMSRSPANSSAGVTVGALPRCS